MKIFGVLSTFVSVLLLAVPNEPKLSGEVDIEALRDALETIHEPPSAPEDTPVPSMNINLEALRDALQTNYEPPSLIPEEPSNTDEGYSLLYSLDSEPVKEKYLFKAKTIDFCGNAAISKLLYFLDMEKTKKMQGRLVKEIEEIQTLESLKHYSGYLLELYGDYCIQEVLSRNQNEFSGLILQKEKHFVVCFSGTKSLGDWRGDFNAAAREYSDISSDRGTTQEEEEDFAMFSQEAFEMQLRNDFTLVTPQTLQPQLKSSSNTPKHGHSGFIEHFSQSKKPLKKTVRKAISLAKDETSSINSHSNVKFTFLGHSLGGPLALNAAYFVARCISQSNEITPDQIEINVMTFGAPPAFSQKAALEFNKLIDPENVIRVYNPKDPLPNLTAILNFVHVGIDYDYRLDKSRFRVKDNHSIQEICNFFSTIEQKNKKII